MTTLREKLLGNTNDNSASNNSSKTLQTMIKPTSDSSSDESSLFMKLQGMSNKVHNISNSNSTSTDSPFYSKTTNSPYTHYGIIGLTVFIVITISVFFGKSLFQGAFQNILKSFEVISIFPPPKKPPPPKDKEAAVEQLRNTIQKKIKNKIDKKVAKETFKNQKKFKSLLSDDAQVRDKSKRRTKHLNEINYFYISSKWRLFKSNQNGYL